MGGTVALRGVIFGGLPNDDAGHQAGQNRERQAQPVAHAQQIKDGKRGHGDERCTDVGAHAQGAQKVFHRSAFFGAHQEDADERKEDAHGGNEHRRNDGTQLKVGRQRKGRGT